MPALATKYTCTGCMACSDKCPTRAIFNIEGDDGHRYIRVDQTKCIECKLCEKTCPIVNGQSYGNLSLTSKFLAGWSQISELRDNAATSGIFGTIAKSIIENGGWVAGAVMDGIACNYQITNSLSDIARLQGSKYTSSNPQTVYSDILKILKEGKIVLFSGLPCHVAALLSFIPSSLHGQLYTIDLICGGVSSPLLLKKFTKHHSNIKSILSFRNKINGWKPLGYKYSLTYELDSGQIISEPEQSRNLVTDGFACELTDRYSCYDCQFTGIHRKSDITIGDLWKDDLFPDQHHNGVSSIIVHSAKGQQLLDKAFISYTSIDSKKVLKPNFRIYNGKSLKRYFPERILLGWCFDKLSYKVLTRLYAGDLKTKIPLWWPIATYRLLSFKMSNLYNKIRNKKILKQIYK